MITDPAIKAALKCVETEITLTDKGQGRGAGSLLLVVRRMSNGGVSAQWFAKSKRNGVRTKLALGRYPEMTLAMARQRMLNDVSPALKAGKRLKVANTDWRPTMEAMFQGYVASLEGRPSHAEVQRVLLKTPTHCAVEHFGRDTLPADVEPEDVADYLALFHEDGFPGAADKARSYVSSAFNWARKSSNDPKNPNRRKWGVKGNPVEDVPRDSDASSLVDRNLDDWEIRKLWMAADASKPFFTLETAGVIRLMLACGQRVEETLRMDGCEIDLATATWNMPKDKTKMKVRDHSIPIPRQVLGLLAELKDVHGDGPLFPSRGGAKNERILPRSVRQPIKRWLGSKPGIMEHFTPRDLRRTWKSRAGELGMSDKMKHLIQQHASSDAGTVHYDRAKYLPQMREAMKLWEDYLDRVLADDKVALDKAA